MFRKLGAIALALCATNVLAGEVGSKDEYIYASTLQGSSTVSIATSPRNDITLAWTDVGDDGSLDVFATVRNGSYFAMPVRVNTTVIGDQQSPRLARSASGNSLVVWASGKNIYGQQLAATLDPVAAEFLVSAGNGAHSDPAVAADAHGNFIVIWRRVRNDNTELVGRRFAPDSTAIGPIFVISTPQSVPSGPASVSMDAGGDFAVSWQAIGDTRDVYVRAFASDGAPMSDAAVAGTMSALERRNPAVAMDAHGRFVVTWSNTDTSGANAIEARQYLAGGTPAGLEFTVASAQVDSQSAPAVARDAAGDFALAWDVSALSGRQIFTQIFKVDGTRAGPQSIGDTWLTAPAISMDADGDTAVAAVNQRGGQEIAAVTLVGPEPIDVELTISESADPVVVNTTETYTITVTNRHAASEETGIAEIDSAIGLLRQPQVVLSTGGLVQQPGLCWDSDGWRRHCHLEALAAGESTSFPLNVTPTGPPAVGVFAFIDTLRFVDPDANNNSVEENTEVVCANGQGAGSVRIARAPTSIDEGASAVIEVERVGGSCGDVSVRYSWGAGQLQWADGEAGTKSMTVANLNPQDNIDEDPQPGEFRLFLPQGGVVLGEPSSVTYTLNDDDPEPTVSITPATIVRSEDGNYSVDFFVTLSNPSDRNPSVKFALGGTATRDSDYRLWSPQTQEVTFYGRYTSVWVNLHVINDSATEQDETVTVTLTDATHAVLSSQATATLTIQDDDRPTVSIVGSDRTQAEGTTTPSVLIHLSKLASVPVTVPLNWSGSATLGQDFTAPTSVTIPAGVGQAVLQFNVIADGLDEDQENAVLTLGQPNIGSLGADTTYVLSITDIDPTPSITFVQQVQRGSEGEKVTLSAELSAVSGREVRVALDRSGQAQFGADYTMSSESIVIPAGTKVSGPVVTLTDDKQVETPETATFTMGAMTNVLPGSQTQETVVILDNDPAGL